MARKKDDSSDVVIYWSPQDERWIAHSLDMDQIGTGDGVVDALADLILAVHQVFEEAKKDNSINPFRKAPANIIRKAAKARKLPREVFEVAYRKVHNQWPDDLIVDVSPQLPNHPLFKTEFDPFTASV